MNWSHIRGACDVKAWDVEGIEDVCEVLYGCESKVEWNMEGLIVPRITLSDDWNMA